MVMELSTTLLFTKSPTLETRGLFNIGIFKAETPFKSPLQSHKYAFRGSVAHSVERRFKRH